MALEATLNGVMAEVTRKTITDPIVLWRDIEQARERGWAHMHEEMLPDVGGVAAVADVAIGRNDGCGNHNSVASDRTK